MGNFNFGNLPEEPENEALPVDAPAPAVITVYQTMKEDTFDSLQRRGIPIIKSELPPRKGFITALMKITPEQKRQLEDGWSRMRTSPTIRNLSSLANRYGGGGGGGGGYRNRNRNRNRTRNRSRSRSRERNRTRNNRNRPFNREQAEENATRHDKASILPDADDAQLIELLTKLGL